MRTRLVGITVFCAVLAVGASSASAHGHGGPSGWGWGGGRHSHAHGFTNTVFAGGAGIEHANSSTGAMEAITQPDDITHLGRDIFVGFQNGVGPQGQASASGNSDSTVVEFNRWGQEVAQWDVVGKCDGVTADPLIGGVIATVNEDANSSLYVIDPGSAAPVHYSYDEALPSDGGTDAISIYHGMILISASAPGTTAPPSGAAPQPTYPAVYRATLDPTTQVATVAPLFFDEDNAVVANVGSGEGQTVALALTDPDSNEDVPFYAERFAGDFMLTSQGDQQQIFIRHAGRPNQSLAVLNLSASVDDTAWPSTSDGAIYTTDNDNDTINRITGPFRPGEVFAAVTPCDQNDAPATCPGPGFPPNYLGQTNQWTGQITQVPAAGPSFEPQGMLFLPSPSGSGRGRFPGHSRRVRRGR
jgi:hypothetical protein